MRADQYELDARLAERHWWWVARRMILARLMDRLVGTATGRRVLEVGCSTGSNLPMLRRYGSVRAIEMHRPAVEFCRRHHPDIQVDQAAIPDPLDDRFDIICLFDVLEHILDDRLALDWIDDHLAPGGMVLLTVPAYPFLWSRHDEVAHHHRRYTMKSLIPLVSERFDLRYATHFNTHLFPAIAAVRLIQRLLRLPGGEDDKAAGGAGPLNALLRTVFALERLWLPSIRLPFGVSIFAAAAKRALS